MKSNLNDLRKQTARALIKLVRSNLRREGGWVIAEVRALQILRPEVENLSGAISWALEQKQRKLALELYEVADYLLVTFGYYDEALVLCDEVIRQAGELAPLQVASWKATTLAYIHWQRNELDQARTLAAEALAESRRLKDPVRVAESKIVLADIYSYEKARLKEAGRLYEEALRVLRKKGSSMSLAWALNDYADYWNDEDKMDDPRQALPFCEESRSLYQAVGDEEGVVLSQMTLLDIRIKLGQFAVAETLLKDLRVLSTTLGRPDMQPQLDWSEAMMRERQGDGESRRGSPSRAAQQYRKASTLAKRARAEFARIKATYEVAQMDRLIRRVARKSEAARGKRPARTSRARPRS